jgi:hypothetical protein
MMALDTELIIDSSASAVLSTAPFLNLARINPIDNCQLHDKPNQLAKMRRHLDGQSEIEDVIRKVSRGPLGAWIDTLTTKT